MCVNDILAQGAEPLFFLDYFSCGKLDPSTTEAVVAGIATACKKAGCALLGMIIHFNHTSHLLMYFSPMYKHDRLPVYLTRQTVSRDKASKI